MWRPPDPKSAVIWLGGLDLDLESGLHGLSNSADCGEAAREAGRRRTARGRVLSLRTRGLGAPARVRPAPQISALRWHPILGSSSGPDKGPDPSTI